MCQLATFIYRDGFETVDLRFGDLESHADTYTKNPTCTEKNEWYEGHYLPSGEIELRTPQGRNKTAEKWLKDKYPTFEDFIWRLFVDGTLPPQRPTQVRKILWARGIRG